MTSNFVILKEEEFISWAKNQFEKFELTTPKQGRELVICVDLQVHGLELHIYTSVEPKVGRTREKGEDAIRFILFDRYSGKPVSSTQKVLRVEGVWNRMTQRVESLLEEALRMKIDNQFCKCETYRAHTIKRTNTRNGSIFYGCSLFPACNQARFNKLNHAATQYPLKLNPLKEHLIVETPVAVVPTTAPLPRQKITGDFTRWKVDPENTLIPSKEFPHAEFSFEKFNCVQSTVFKSDVWRRDVNLILGTATSSGKTVCAEMAISAALNEV
jgi:ssDNA-binding Zn-finger/Zn-ribbon topoisomerase 1